MKTVSFLLVAFPLLVVACGSEGDTSGPQDPMPSGTGGTGPDDPASTAMAGPSGDPASNPMAPAPTIDIPEEPPFGGADFLSWSTASFTLEAGQEHYLCFTAPLGADLTVNGYHTAGQEFVHHLALSRIRQGAEPDPDGLWECNDVAFRSSWDRIFLSGAGESTLEFPEDAGHVMTADTQLTVQMHLLNTSLSAVTGSVTVNMRRATTETPRPVNTFVFGTAAVELPPQQPSNVVGNCAVSRDVRLIAGFPHMHLLGTSLRFEAGPSAAELEEVFVRDPYDFDDQQAEAMDVMIQQGSHTRVTCGYDNPHAATVGYGSSTNDEMCYFIGFAVDSQGIGACLEVLPPLF